MITLIEALNYRCLRYISQPLGPFHVLVGPNASGKTTFLDVVAFLGRLVSDGVDAAITERTRDIHDLFWRREGMRFELAVEAQAPESREHWKDPKVATVRYEIVLGIDPQSQRQKLLSERVLLKIPTVSRPHQREHFPDIFEVPKTLAIPENRPNVRSVIPSGLVPLGHSVLWNIDGAEYPASTWLRKLLASGVQQLVLNSLSIRRPSSPGQGFGFKPDGSNLPWVLERLRERWPERFRQWISHLRTAFPDLEDIKTIERPEDRHRYLVLQYTGGLEVPSWMASDGTLRMLALTLPAYLEDFNGIYLIEEPENGIHPRAIETMTQSLSSVYNAQVLLATHSPVILSTVEAEQVLCFSKNSEGATDIARGSEHPALQSWKHETTLGTLFAAGVLG